MPPRPPNSAASRDACPPVLAWIDEQSRTPGPGSCPGNRRSCRTNQRSSTADSSRRLCPARKFVRLESTREKALALDRTSALARLEGPCANARRRGDSKRPGVKRRAFVGQVAVGRVANGRLPPKGASGPDQTPKRTSATRRREERSNPVGASSPRPLILPGVGWLKNRGGPVPCVWPLERRADQEVLVVRGDIQAVNGQAHCVPGWSRPDCAALDQNARHQVPAVRLRWSTRSQHFMAVVGTAGPGRPTGPDLTDASEQLSEVHGGRHDRLIRFLALLGEIDIQQIG